MLSRIKKFLCSIGWHGYLISLDDLDEYGSYKCTRCGAVGWRDSQGNLF